MDPVLVTFGQICNFHDPNLVTFYFYELTQFLNGKKYTPSRHTGMDRTTWKLTLQDINTTPAERTKNTREQKFKCHVDNQA